MIAALEIFSVTEIQVKSILKILIYKAADYVFL